MYVIIRIRGTARIKRDIRETMNLLRISKPNHCVIVPENEVYKGMIQKVRNYVTYGEIGDKTLEKLIEKRGKISQKKKIEKKDIGKIVKLIKDGKLKDSKIKPVFQLNPPKKGYGRKGIKKDFKQRGALGYRGNKINDLLERMI